MNIKELNNDNCTGCMACVSVCPKNALSVCENKEGFLFPKLNKSLCVNCGKCVNICSSIDKEKIHNENIVVYGAHVKDKKILDRSQSGGMGWTIGKYFTENKGLVYGAVIDKNFLVKHIRCETTEDLKKTQGSKYVQSYISKEVYNNILKDINEGKKVLFTGTPCQCASVKKLCKNSDNLYLIDLICHGVQSPKYYLDYLNSKKKKLGEIREFRFRDHKFTKWGGMRTYIKTHTKENFYADYQHLNLGDTLFRFSCYTCPYANRNRVGDFTIGDYWGVKREEPEIFHEKGVSALLINTEKGINIFNEIKDNLFYKETTVDKIIKGGNDKLDHHRGINCKIISKRNTECIVFNLFGFNGLYVLYKIRRRLGLNK